MSQVDCIFRFHTFPCQYFIEYIGQHACILEMYLMICLILADDEATLPQWDRHNRNEQGLLSARPDLVRRIQRRTRFLTRTLELSPLWSLLLEMDAFDYDDQEEMQVYNNKGTIGSNLTVCGALHMLDS